MNVRSLFLAVAFATSLIGNSHAQGYAGLGSSADEGFSVVKPGKNLSFPADHGPHGNFRIEWWYVTANLVDENGTALGLQWTLFRNALKPESLPGSGWQSRQFWLGHSAITTSETHLSAEMFARGGVGQAGVTPVPFGAWIDNWRLQSVADPDEDPFARMTMQAAGPGFSYNVKMTAKGPLVRHGLNGFSRKSDRGQASYYYSQPFYEMAGSVTLKGVTTQVIGKAWLDREWSSQPLAADQTGWDWFSLHLDNGSKIMLFRVRRKQGRDFYSGSRIMPNGDITPLSNDDVTFTPKNHHTVAGKSIPTSWRISLSKENISFTALALNPQSWMDNSFGYWEGPIIVKGDMNGTGYLEMTGY
jgi:predicted secreted hydrolase